MTARSAPGRQQPRRASQPEAETPIHEYRFLLAGVAFDEQTREALRETLEELIEPLRYVALLSVNQGLQLDLEVTDTAPFSVADYEDYLIDHVLQPAVDRAGAADGSSGKITPLKARHARRD